MTPRGLVFVGEAPSVEEVDAGLPLVGPSGRVFAQILRMAGIARGGNAPEGWMPDLDHIREQPRAGWDLRRRGLRPMLWERQDHAITNVFDWQLAGNDVRSVCGSAPEAKAGGWDDGDYYITGSGYLRPDYRDALSRLGAEVAAAHPAVVVPLGATALWAFTGSTDIVASRGTVMRATRIAPGIKVCPTLHPAHVIQDWRMLTVVVADVARAAREATDPTRILHRGARELWIEPTIGDLEVWWDERGRHSELLAVDIETSRGQVTCVGIAADSVSAVCVPLVDYRKPSRSYWDTVDEELAALAWLARVLGTDTPKVLQNGLYDVTYLWGQLGLRVKNYREDTRLMHHSLYAELPKSLAFLGSTYARPGLPWKTMRTQAAAQEKRDA